MTELAITRKQLLRHRFVRQGLAAAPDSLASVADVAVLDAGVQDTGPDGHGWALANRGAPMAARGEWDNDVFLAWTLRGAPHAYRRSDAAAVALATSPFSDDDAAKRIFDASKPLRAAGMEIREALRVVAQAERKLVTKPTVKGDVSGALNQQLDEAYLRTCRPCKAVHIYEQPFRLAALQAGLALEPGTAPPVLHRLKGLKPLEFARSGADADPRLDVVRNVLRFAPGVTLKDVTAVIDGAAKDVKAHLPADTVTVTVTDMASSGRAERLALAEDAGLLSADADIPERTVRLLSPFDPYLQLHDRALIVPDETHRKYVWRILGRPGVVVADGEPIATWRPKTTGKSVSVEIDPWSKPTAADKDRIGQEAERLAQFRGKTLASVNFT